MTSDNQPYDLTAERAVVGTAMSAPSVIPWLITNLSEGDFFRQNNGWIFAACCDLFMSDMPIKPETVHRRLSEMRLSTGKSPLDAMGGPEPIFEAVELSSPDELEYWAGRVRSKSMERQALEILNSARAKLSNNPEDVHDLIMGVERQLSDVGREANVHTGTVSLKDSVEVVREGMESFINDPYAIDGYCTYALRSWDRAIDGFKPGATYNFYAPTSRFKSLFTQNLGWMMSREGLPGLWFTTEMTHKEVTERIVGFESGVNLLWTRMDGTFPSYHDTITSAMGRVSQYPIYICDRAVNANMLRAEVMRRVRWDGIKYVIVDLLNQVSIDKYKDNSVAQQEALMKEIKQLAKDAGVPIILVSHVAKGDSQLRKSAVLDIEAMKGSAALGQDADVAISLMPVKRNMDPEIDAEWLGLTRDELKALQNPEGPGVVTMMAGITKNRHGPMKDLLFNVNFANGGRITEREFSPQQGSFQ